MKHSKAARERFQKMVRTEVQSDHQGFCSFGHYGTLPYLSMNPLWNMSAPNVGRGTFAGQRAWQ
jgi:hypothetical protein